MIVLQTMAVAFAMFSALPVPQFTWNSKNMRYALCAFPLIGGIIGALWSLCGALPLPDMIRAGGFCLIPVLVTGGIHLDGYADTCDALASYGDREKKLEILSDAAKYDVACTSSGVERKGNREGMGNATHCGICHSFAADGRCISLLKVLMTNECIYDCKYCINRRSNDTVRTSFTPQELCELTIQFYRRNYIEGLFLSSGIRRSPDETMEQIYRVLFLLRRQYHFNGYIHVKGIPGASAELVQAVGYLADRMSLNLELPTAQGLQKLAPGKTREKILTPMRQIQNGIREQKLLLTDSGRIAKKPDNGSSLYLPGDGQILREKSSYGVSTRSGKQERFVPAGQSTQIIVGATQENDYQILT